jgi:hypothetical protein
MLCGGGFVWVGGCLLSVLRGAVPGVDGLPGSGWGVGVLLRLGGRPSPVAQHGRGLLRGRWRRVRGRVGERHVRTLTRLLWHPAWVFRVGGRG